MLLKKLNNFVAPIFVIILIFLFVVVSMNYGWDTVLSAKPLAPFEDQWLNFLVVFELSMGAGFSWWPNMGGVAKLCKTTKLLSGQTLSDWFSPRLWAPLWVLQHLCW